MARLRKEGEEIFLSLRIEIYLSERNCLKRTPCVQKSNLVLLETSACSRTRYPTTSPSLVFISSATRLATDIAASRLGWLHIMKQFSSSSCCEEEDEEALVFIESFSRLESLSIADWAEASKSIRGAWVVLPDLQREKEKEREKKNNTQKYTREGRRSKLHHEKKKHGTHAVVQTRCRHT